MASRFTVFKKDSWRVNMRGWPFVIVVGLILAVIAVIDGGGLAGARATNPVTTSACNFTVNATDVNIRSDATASSPSVQKLAVGERVGGTGIISNGFRQLADGRWVLDGYLTPVVGNTCA